ncbi:MAG: ferredoxin [Myxococcales bacterium]|nr:ferredoxin [Myxococcales bacterium]
MKIVVDYDLCEANAFCQKLAPEVFRVEDDDSLTVLIEHPPEALREKVVAAAKKCPRGAIKIEG